MSTVRWLSPSPLWDDLVAKPAGFRAPALLRFAGDDFIPRYQGVLEENPRDLADFVARPESWREPAVGLNTTPSTRYPLRLYQPVHNRFYLVAASLACRVPGLPEHTVDVAGGDEVAFVLRRITVSVNQQTKAETETGEWAWVVRPDGTSGWVGAAGQALVTDEERLPLFATTYEGSGGLKGTVQRRVFAGLVPASRREAYTGGRELSAQTAVPAPGSLDDPRVIEFQRAVLDPWTELKEFWDGRRGLAADYVTSALDSAEISTAYLLLDFYDFLKAQLPGVAEVVDGSRNASTLVPAQRALYDALNALGVTDRAGGSRALLPAAMKHAAGFRAQLETPANPTAPLPGTYTRRVLVGDPRAPGSDPNADEAGLVALLARQPSPLELDTPPVGVRKVKKLVMDALATAGAAPSVLPEQLPSRKPANAQGDDWFVIRCVYLRPRCGKKSPPVVSERSERFRLVSFFEPDAPARHLRVAMPVDTSPATLRKYNRNVAFVISDQLRKQMSRAANLKDLMDGKAGPEGGGLDFSVICSFSIPIITICAFILLMIIVVLLNIIFWWLPLFRICFPVPKLKG